ncbi:uncharacterized protein LOC103509263 [Diaphorina citri]|uniref:Uncharacterized protein LOC103509263 n=1 Tax=Diaphorina citri TaxID=121845 RepID=A0A3Q0IT66_DIACI|nr:uncharacterized protein LOC103509263 [Diaphorina citri]
MKNEYAYSSLFNEAYLNQIEQLHRLYELQTHHLESTRNMNIKLEATLAAKDKTIAQFKQLFIAVKQKYQEDLEAMTSRYNSVQASLTRQRSEQMELYYQIDLNREKMAKLKAKLPGHDKGNTLATLGPPVTTTSSQSNPNHHLSLSRFLANEPTTPSTQPNSSTLIEE